MVKLFLAHIAYDYTVARLFLLYTRTMHVFFSGIGGAGIGPLALVAKEAGFEVSGSDKQTSSYIEYLRGHGLDTIHIGQTKAQLAKLHAAHPIDWYVYSSAVEKENPDAPELAFVRSEGIKHSKRDEFINLILREKHLKLIAIAGTHGKTTTTAMVIWLAKQLKLPISYNVGAKLSFGDMGEYDKKSDYFVYEADEFDRNFLAFEPHMSIIAGVSWDHHEIFPTREDYQQAFREFMSQSHWSLIWQDDADYLGLSPSNDWAILDPSNKQISSLTLPGLYNRLDGWLAIQAIHELTTTPLETLIKAMNKFPGLQRRMEEIVPNLYSDYAHTPEKIRGAMSVALEMAAKKNQDVIVIYEPLTNRRQHYMLDSYGDCFDGAKHVYWIPSYLAREDPSQRIIPPEELISHLAKPSVAEPRLRNAMLQDTIRTHLDRGDMVVCMAGGGGGSLDEWVRGKFKA